MQNPKRTKLKSFSVGLPVSMSMLLHQPNPKQTKCIIILLKIILFEKHQTTHMIHLSKAIRNYLRIRFFIVLNHDRCATARKNVKRSARR